MKQHSGSAIFGWIIILSLLGVALLSGGTYMGL